MALENEDVTGPFSADAATFRRSLHANLGKSGQIRVTGFEHKVVTLPAGSAEQIVVHYRGGTYLGAPASWVSDYYFIEYLNQKQRTAFVFSFNTPAAMAAKELPAFASIMSGMTLKPAAGAHVTA